MGRFPCFVCKGFPSFLALPARVPRPRSVCVCPTALSRLSPNGRGGWTPLRPLRGLQETRVATREESGVLGFPSRSSQMSVDAWRAGLGPSARSLSPAAAASAPGAHRLPPPDASYLGLGPVMGTRVPMGAAVVSVSTLLPHPGPYFTRGVPCLGLHDTAALGRLAIREGFLEVSSLHLGPCSRMR